MLELDVTRLIDDVDPFDISAGVAERGKNAGKETWNNAVDDNGHVDSTAIRAFLGY